VWPEGGGKASSCVECQRKKKGCTGGGRVERATKKRAAPASPEKKTKKARIESESEDEAEGIAEVMKELREIRQFQGSQAKEMQRLRREVRALAETEEEHYRQVRCVVDHIFCFMANVEDGEQNWEGGLLDRAEGTSEERSGVSEVSEVDIEEAAQEVALEMAELQAESEEAEGSTPV
jgi:hypothetical protein